MKKVYILIKTINSYFMKKEEIINVYSNFENTMKARKEFLEDKEDYDGTYYEVREFNLLD